MSELTDVDLHDACAQACCFVSRMTPSSAIFPYTVYGSDIVTDINANKASHYAGVYYKRKKNWISKNILSSSTPTNVTRSK